MQSSLNVFTLWLAGRQCDYQELVEGEPLVIVRWNMKRYVYYLPGTQVPHLSKLLFYANVGVRCLRL